MQMIMGTTNAGRVRRLGMLSATLAGVAVRQLVQQPFMFNISKEEDEDPFAPTMLRAGSAMAVIVLACTLAGCEPAELRVPLFVDVEWRLGRIDSATTSWDPSLNAVAPTLRLSPTSPRGNVGTADGTSGCNTYGANYTVERSGELVVSAIMTTLVFCSGYPGVVERTFYRHLDGGTRKSELGRSDDRRGRSCRVRSGRRTRRGIRREGHGVANGIRGSAHRRTRERPGRGDLPDARQEQEREVVAVDMARDRPNDSGSGWCGTTGG